MSGSFMRRAAAARLSPEAGDPFGEAHRISTSDLQRLSDDLGGGWAFRPDKRFGFQVFASQHAAALGDLQTASAEVQDVLGNYWSFGGALVFR